MIEQTPIRVFTVAGCEPCDGVMAALESENFEILGVDGSPGVQAIDLEDEANHELLDSLGLDSIPAAYHGVRQCKIFINEITKKVTFDCRPEEEQESDAQPTDR